MTRLAALCVIAIFVSVSGHCQTTWMQVNHEAPATLTRHFDTGIENTGPNGSMDYRWNLFGYKPIKMDGYQIISSHQPNSNIDIVYFIDESGSTVKRVFTSTAPHNFSSIGPYYDSLNPMGSPDMASALLNGLIGTILQRGFGLK
ncbi:MAG: hypothetical protein RJQ09_14910 [Cyclobacteriaceae bacterium]